MDQKTQLPLQGQQQVIHASAAQWWREHAFDVVFALVLAVVFAAAFAVLAEWVKSALAAPPCEAMVHRLVIEPTPRARCLIFHADMPA